MIKEAIGYGDTIEEAKEAALQSLGAAIDDDVQFDVITMPKPKVLGIFGGAKAEVKAFVEVAEKKQRDKRAQKPKNKKVERTEAPKAVKAEAEAPAEIGEEEKNAVALSTLAADSPAVNAAKYLTDILEKLGCANIEIKVALRDNGAAFYLTGDNLGVAIGRRGETLDSLQYLTGLSANTGNGYYKVSLNIGDYREKREQALAGLANRMARQVLKTGRSRTLEPMNPYERRIIHTAVQDIKGVSSNSIGEGSNRRVVISTDRPHRGGRNDRTTANAAPAVTREPKKDAELPLYGKIN